LSISGNSVAAYFTSFIQQFVPTDDLGNQSGDVHQIDVADEDSVRNTD
jgi:uncharacterized protein YukJ